MPTSVLQRKETRTWDWAAEDLRDLLPFKLFSFSSAEKNQLESATEKIQFFGGEKKEKRNRNRKKGEAEGKVEKAYSYGKEYRLCSLNAFCQ